MEFSFSPFPELTTERLHLRRMVMSDDNEIFFLRSDDGVLKYTDIPKANSIEDARKFIEKIDNITDVNEGIMWAICLKNSNTLIGTICYWNISKENRSAETGYMLHPDFQHKGLMQEALAEVVVYGFEKIKWESIDAEVHPENTSSVKLLERNGFTCIKKSEDTLVYSLANMDNVELVL
ncbi:MAG: GNAT family N-acetyltransferase [Chitinophagaceae bacterium]|nr:GNAT family N-acetyltransferase [Chitinophagaceae bacterium]